MADAETTHKIVEKLEVAGLDKAVMSFDKLALAASQAARALGHVVEEVTPVGAVKEIIDHTEEATDGLDKMADTAKGAGDGMERAFFRGTVAGGLFTKALDFGLEAVGNFLRQSFEVNTRMEAMGSRVQGLYLAMADTPGLDFGDKVQRSVVVANAALERFQQTALKTATPVEVIESASSNLQAPLFQAGKSLEDVYQLTELVAGASKVMGDDAQQAAAVVAKAIATGTVDGERGLALILSQQAQVNAKLKPEENLRRVQQVLEQMAGPVSIVTKDTAGALNRWTILSERILRDVTLPIYNKIGSVIGSIVDWTDQHGSAVKDVIADVTDLLEGMMSVADGAWNVTRAFFTLPEVMNPIRSELQSLWAAGKAFGSVIEAVGGAFSAIAETMAVLTDPDRGLGKLTVLADAFEIKMLRVAQFFGEMLNKMVEAAIPKSVREHLPEFLRFGLEEMEANQKAFEAYIQGRERQNARHATALGMSAQTSLGRALERQAAGVGLSEQAQLELFKSSALERQAAGVGLSEQAQLELFKSIHGKGKAVMQIDQVNIKQDFRDQDPDRVLVEFVRDLERLGENALQTAVGGGLTELGPGGVY